MKMRQILLPACVIVMLLLQDLCIEYPSVACTYVTPTCSTREPAHLQVMAVIPIDSVYKSEDIQLPDWQKVKKFFQEDT